MITFIIPCYNEEDNIKNCISSIKNEARYIPYEIIEYPVNKKERNKIEKQKSLGFPSDYKHVVNVGLFTERKNQKYLFEIAKKLDRPATIVTVLPDSGIKYLSKMYNDDWMKEKKLL